MDKATFRASVGASVLAAVLVIIFVQPILRWSWGLFVSGSSFTVALLTNSIYKSAALGDRNWVSAAFAIFLLGITGLLTGAMILRKYLPETVLEQFNRIRKSQSRTKSVIVATSDILYFLVLLFLLTAVYADLQLTASFEQRLHALAPYATEQQEEEFRAMWATMGNRSDFEQVVDAMEKLAAEGGVELPDLLLE